MPILIIAVAGLLAVAASVTLAPRLRVASPLILVVLGIAISFLPFVPVVEIQSEWILEGVLPPLLYSAAVSMPAMNFRREFTAISGLSVVLVVLSTVILGIFFAWAIPGLGLWWGLALGAIVSPTDAVATSIVKSVGVSGRVASVLEGESLLNDATALVLLRAALAGTVVSVSAAGVVGEFARAVIFACLTGIVVGKLNLRVRARLADATVNTVVSFTVPFLAAIPAELLGGSGLVAAVVAGLVTGHGAARRLSAFHRLSDSQNWQTVEVILEGAIFLVMGLELFGIVTEVGLESVGVVAAVWVAAGALVLTILVRAAYIVPLLRRLDRRARRGERVKPRLDVVQQRLEAPDVVMSTRGPGRGATTAGRLERIRTRTRRVLADIEYFRAAPLSWRDGGVLVWSGMRGAVTVAAAQTLPSHTPHRALLIFIAFCVAGSSLLIQGGTLPLLVRRIKPQATDRALIEAEHAKVLALLGDVDDRVSADAADAKEPMTGGPLRLAVIAAQRNALLDARDDGTYGADVLRSALVSLDAEQISIELQAAPGQWRGDDEGP